MKNYIKLLRVSNYIKNLIIFLPVIFGRCLTEKDVLLKTLSGFAAFCFLSSAVYILNDLTDAESDRKNPAKSDRPIASGKISVKNAAITAAVLFVLCFAVYFIFTGFETGSFLALLLYSAVNLFYSIKLRQVPVIDIICVSSCYVIRLFFGSYISGISLSVWITATVTLIALFMSTAKRRAELNCDGGADGRAVLEIYGKKSLSAAVYTFAVMSAASYILWIVKSDFVTAGMRPWLFASFIPVVFLFVKYIIDAEKSDRSDPVSILLGDRWLMSVSVIYSLFMLAVLYIK